MYNPPIITVIKNNRDRDLILTPGRVSSFGVSANGSRELHFDLWSVYDNKDSFTALVKDKVATIWWKVRQADGTYKNMNCNPDLGTTELTGDATTTTTNTDTANSTAPSLVDTEDEAIHTHVATTTEAVNIAKDYFGATVVQPGDSSAMEATEAWEKQGAQEKVAVDAANAEEEEENTVDASAKSEDTVDTVGSDYEIFSEEYEALIADKEWSKACALLKKRWPDCQVTPRQLMAYKNKTLTAVKEKLGLE